MSLAVLKKTLREYRVVLVAIVLGIVLLEIVLVWGVAETARELDKVRPVLELPLVRSFLRLALGADLLEDLSATAMMTFGFGHPMLYALAWTLVLTIGTGVVAGEIGRGTADLLLALPVPRVAVYASTSVVWVLAAVGVSAAVVAGLWLGERIFPLWEPTDFPRLTLVAVNFLALNLAVAGSTMFISSVVSRRGLAVAILLTALLASDVVNLLAQFWEGAHVISFLGFLHYYRPLLIVRSGHLPAPDIAVLLAVALLAWLAGLWHFARRDIPAV